MARRALGWSLVLLTLLLVGCDHATKFAAEAALTRGRAVEVVPGLLDLRYARNHDTAFSLTRGIVSPLKRGALTAFAAASIVAMGVLWWRRRQVAPRAEQAGYALVMAGALGNVIDRVARGYVVDFIHLRHWPVFNVADIAVVAGVLLLGFCAFKQPKETAAPS